MKLIVDNDKFKMAFVSGPRHNFLSLVIVDNKLNFEFEINDLSDDNKGGINNQQQVKKQILEGLDYVNKELGTNYRISHAEYSSSDTSSNNLYTALTINIIKEAHSNGFLKKI